MEALELLRRTEGPLTQPRKPLRVIGIDLGTTNSTVAEILWLPGQTDPPVVRCLSIDQATTQGRYTHVLVPSVVALYQNKTWVGEGAKRLRARPELGIEEGRNLFAECKNDMGLQRTYHRAPAGYRSAREIATHLLKFLHDAARQESEVPLDRVVVTVPASFQAPQRQDTLEAAIEAALELRGGDLLDEPVAGFLDYLISRGDTELPPQGENRNLVVFDFGGGTCDVAVLRLGRTSAGRLAVSPLAVSRYHRLGGGDIDRAIVHDVLLKQLQEQNHLERFALSYEEKKQRVQPALLSVAEALKQKLCQEITRLISFGRWESIDKSTIAQILPGVYPVSLKDRTLSLQSPTLRASDFDKVLAPFWDRDLLYPKEDNYHLTCSIFAPLTDAIHRAHLSASDVHRCLLIGGSSLIPQVAEAVKSFFPRAELLTYRDQEDIQTAVARGAAFHALAIALFGQALVQPVCHDDICFTTSTGVEVLVPSGTPLPFPPTGEYKRRADFRAPETVFAGVAKIQVKIVGGEDKRPLFGELWQIPAPISKGDPLWLEYRFDENQVLHLRMGRENEEDYGFTASIENPLTYVSNPQSSRAQIDEIEEKLRTGQVPSEDISSELEKVSDLYRKLGQREKALDYYRRVLKALGRPDVSLLNKMANRAREMGDRERADRFFYEATAAETWSGTWFNWALVKEQWGDLEEAVRLVAKAPSLEEDPAYLTFQASLAGKLGNKAEHDKLMALALKRFGSVETLSDFDLFWLRFAASSSGDKTLGVYPRIIAPKRFSATLLVRRTDRIAVGSARGLKKRDCGSGSVRLCQGEIQEQGSSSVSIHNRAGITSECCAWHTPAPTPPAPSPSLATKTAGIPAPVGSARTPVPQSPGAPRRSPPPPSFATSASSAPPASAPAAAVPVDRPAALRASVVPSQGTPRSSSAAVALLPDTPGSSPNSTRGRPASPVDAVPIALRRLRPSAPPVAGRWPPASPPAPQSTASNCIAGSTAICAL